MKDSWVGSYGVVALTLALLGKFMLLVELKEAWVPAALVAGHAVSRFCRRHAARHPGLRAGRRPGQGQAPGHPALPGRWRWPAVSAALGLLLLPLGRGLAASPPSPPWRPSGWRACTSAGWAGTPAIAWVRRSRVAELAFYLGLVAAWPV